MIVLDASAAFELLLNTKSGRQVAGFIRSSATSLHAPHLIDIEITQTLRRYLLAGEVSLQRAETALEAWQDIAVTRHPHSPLIRDIWGYRNNLTAYDGAYVVLAEHLDAVLVTCDSALAGAPDLGPRVQVITP